MSRLVFATSNPGKVAELRALTADLALDVLSSDEAGVGDVHVVEDGDTFAENAAKKARAISRATGLAALADDSGLEVDALDGAPGVFSARYAGEGATDAANNEKLLANLAGVAPARRTARFRCALALADTGGQLGDELLLTDGVCEGVILEAGRGSGGFGYDPLFYVPALGATFAELGVGPKSGCSHRAQAMRAMKPNLVRYFGLLTSTP